MEHIEIAEGDITQLAVDAIVNPANSALQLGSGVAGAIRGKGGPSIQRECDAIGFCAQGNAVVTGAGDLPAKWVIHAVGPLGSDPDRDRLLASACRAALERAREVGAESIAIPAISTGVFGFPMEDAAKILIATARAFARDNEQPERIVFCLRGRGASEIFESIIGQTGQTPGRRVP